MQPPTTTLEDRGYTSEEVTPLKISNGTPFEISRGNPTDNLKQAP